MSTIKSLLHFESESNNAPVDEAGLETWSKSGNATLSTNSPKFGSKCIYFSGSSDYITSTNTNGTFNISKPGSYEFEFFIKCDAHQNGSVFSCEDISINLKEGNYYYFSYLSTNSEAGYSWSDENWHHFLLRLVDGTFTLYHNGSQMLAGNRGSGVTPSSIKLGGFTGYMDEFVFRTSASSGTPIIPTEPYSTISAPNSMVRIKDIISFGNRVNSKINSGSGGTMSWPASDNKVYVIKNGAFVQATLVEQPVEWEPAIDDTKDIVLTIDNDMTPFQLTGNNVEVNT